MISKYDIISTLLEAIRQLNIRITNAYWLRSSSIDEMYGDFFYSLCKKNLKNFAVCRKEFCPGCELQFAGLFPDFVTQKQASKLFGFEAHINMRVFGRLTAGRVRGAGAVPMT